MSKIGLDIYWLRATNIIEICFCSAYNPAETYDNYDDAYLAALKKIKSFYPNAIAKENKEFPSIFYANPPLTNYPLDIDSVIERAINQKNGGK